jgi:hypothetical protein
MERNLICEKKCRGWEAISGGMHLVEEIEIEIEVEVKSAEINQLLFVGNKE